MENKRRLTRNIVAEHLWGTTPFRLIDVGASGGIDSRWGVFGDLLEAVGFDPLVAEVDRLNAANVHPGIRYEAVFVGCADYDRLFPRELREDRVATKNNDAFERSSAAAAQRQLRGRGQPSYVETVFNFGAPVVVAEGRVSLDDFVGESARALVDFIKVDTDGHDIEVLLGAEAIFANGGALGVSVEMQHHGPVHDYANTFDNIDRFLRRHGFTLFDLHSSRYSRAALPEPFALDLPAQTISGPVLVSEGVYFRDLADVRYERMWGYDVSRERVLKLACLYEVFELRDCAAELLLNRGGFLANKVREGLLDRLVRKRGSYRALIEEFERDCTRFFHSAQQP